jgi:hypothetical protein
MFHSKAENRVLEYMKMVAVAVYLSLRSAHIPQMNRPYGAADVFANLKGAVPKTATQKVLLALAEKGELVQKGYGSFPFLVALCNCAYVGSRSFSASVLSSAVWSQAKQPSSWPIKRTSGRFPRKSKWLWKRSTNCSKRRTNCGWPRLRLFQAVSKNNCESRPSG